MRRKPVILISLLLAAFVINLDTTIVNVALPTLVSELHASNSQLQWVVDAFNLLFAASVVAMGSLSDRFGRKGMLLAGLSVFGLASLAGGLTDSAGALIAARSVPGSHCRPRWSGCSSTRSLRPRTTVGEARGRSGASR